MDINTPVIATRPRGRNPNDISRFVVLNEYAQKGGPIVFIEGVEWPYKRGTENRIDLPWFPFKPRIQRARGLWTCIPHIVKEHPIFDGLPSGRAMRDLYERIWTSYSLRELDGEAVVASIGFDWFSGDIKLQYMGPGESWWGSDVSVAALGKGKCVVSQLRIVSNLGSDPVADKLLWNIINFVSHEE